MENLKDRLERLGFTDVIVGDPEPLPNDIHYNLDSDKEKQYIRHIHQLADRLERCNKAYVKLKKQL